jgi:hypothetical protein
MLPKMGKGIFHVWKDQSDIAQSSHPDESAAETRRGCLFGDWEIMSEMTRYSEAPLLPQSVDPIHIVVEMI